MIELSQRLARILESGERVALITVVGTQESTPRSAGTSMAVRSNGDHLGTVGGGSGEAEMIRLGLRALDQGEPSLVRLDLTGLAGAGEVMACGGVMDVLAVPWGRELLPVVQALCRAAALRRGARLLTCLSPTYAFGALVVEVHGSLACAGLSAGRAARLAAAVGVELDAAGEGVSPLGPMSHGCLPTTGRLCLEIGGAEWTVFCQEVEPAPGLLICGGGHIALPLSRMGALLGFRVEVIDDRPEFARPDRFPDAAGVTCAPYSQILQSHPLDPGTYVVVVTRGHEHDLECVRRLVGREVGYVGMIGSRRRVGQSLELLLREGISPGALARLHTPIGLDIGAETPAEIALAILAEIVLVHRGGSGASLTLARAVVDSDAPGQRDAEPESRGGGS